MNKYCNHLYGGEVEGYLHTLKIEKNKRIRVMSNKASNVSNLLQNVANGDFYITPNTTAGRTRGVSNIFQLRALFVDVDGQEGNQCYCAYRILEMAENEEIPKPSMIVDSGRGVHVYWKIKHAPRQALYSWQEIEDMLCYRLKCLGSDSRATDASRVLRLPGTRNSKNNTVSHIMYIDDSIEYSMIDIKEKYIKPKKRRSTKAVTSSKKVIKNAFFNAYSLHTARANDMLTLCSIRNYRVNGYRNMIIHCYAYWIGIYVKDKEELEQKVNELNNKFTSPLKRSEIRAVLRSIDKAIEGFIEYEQGIRSGKDKRISKKMREHGGYWYKNETLINRLDITEEEQKRMITIIDTDEKYTRNNEKRKNNRRNEEGLTSREQEKKDKEEVIMALIEKGLNMSKVAKELGMNRSTISRSYKHLFAK